MLKNFYFISPVLPKESPLWAVIVGDRTKQRKSLDGSLVVVKLSIEDSVLFERKKGLRGFTQNEVETFIAENNVKLYTHDDILTELKTSTWTDKMP